MGYDPAAPRKLGSAPLEVSQLGLGCGPIGGFRASLSEAEAEGIVATAHAAGVRLFDTSPLYGHGQSELRVGHALRQVPRESFVLSTKVGRWLTPVGPGRPRDGLRPGGLDFRPTYDLSRDGVLRALEQSYCRLGLTSIDILLMHDVDVRTHGSQEAFEQRYREALAGAYPALDELRRQGVIKAVGIGVNETLPCLRFARDADLDCILLAGRYTLLEQHALDELLPLCVEKDIGILVGGPFNSGILARGPGEGATYDYKAAPPEVLEKARRIEQVCERHGVALAAAALQFPLAHPAIATLIPGAASRAEVLHNVEHLRAPIPPDLWSELRHEGLLHPQAPVPA